MIEPYIETYTGTKFYFLEPKQEDINIQDIAHALSMSCRYSGHCNRFYSIAEHSWLMSRLAEGTGLELACLLHDAAEAYLTDIPSPIKQYLVGYKEMEDKILKVIFNKYNLEYPFSSGVKYLDLSMLSTEAYYLLPSCGDDWSMWDNIKRPKIEHNFKPLCMTPQRAKGLFLDKFHELTDGLSRTN